jgi:hypothetical protein
MRPLRGILLAFIAFSSARAQDPRELVRRSIAQDQLDWLRMKDYTWQARSLEHHFDSRGRVQSTKQEAWETLILHGEPHRRMLERDGKPLSPDDQRKEQQKLDRANARLNGETPTEQQRRLEDAEKRRRREFEFLSEIPELFDLRLEGESAIEGRPVWKVCGAPRPGAQPKSHDAKVLLKIRGCMWIDQATYQWARGGGDNRHDLLGRVSGETQSRRQAGLRADRSQSGPVAAQALVHRRERPGRASQAPHGGPGNPVDQVPEVLRGLQDGDERAGRPAALIFGPVGDVQIA